MKIPGKAHELTIWRVLRAVLFLAILLALTWAWRAARSN